MPRRVSPGFDCRPPRSGDRDGLAYASVARTHVGHKRQINEDRLLDCPERGVWAIADGMGGHRGGDVAAEIVIGALREVTDAASPLPCAQSIEAALYRANQRIRDHALSAGGVIGSTVVVLHIADDRACLFWVGDSRGYRIRAHHLEQLTRDHSLVQELVDAGVISNEAAATHPQANVVTRALGVEAELAIEKLAFLVSPDDILLLCSDGLSRSLENDAAESTNEPGEALADRLLSTALHRDGSDNISFVVIRTEKATSTIGV
ncbi:serine/threonine-protein phosphatase [Sphingomonas sp. JC676]|uniref:PP2C family protein-serine/threonine phosphatase n=1 Tax=Sphingomonas sp. JC676 TaxID=2768065 RepID=UPI0016584D82|nr:protein phosphatase 2C domain-containing protein [Sphingomonas sp. JC676]MBC9033393.1 serine/threonine-protein phosphatase [Sphingomonas sp. JC676]